MSVTGSARPETRIVLVEGDQENSSAGLRAKLSAAGSGSIFIDLEALPNVTSGSLGALATFRRRNPDARIVLTGAGPLARRLLSIVGFERIFEIAGIQTPVRPGTA